SSAAVLRPVQPAMTRLLIALTSSLRSLGTPPSPRCCAFDITCAIFDPKGKAFPRQRSWAMNDVGGPSGQGSSQGSIKGQEHWTKKGAANRFLWEKRAPGGAKNGAVLFVHGSSMASQPTFDLHVPGRPHSSAMEFFAERGFDTWSIDMEGYGRSTKDRGLD